LATINQVKSHFLLVNNANLHHILYRFYFPSYGRLLIKFSLRVILCEYPDKL